MNSIFGSVNWFSYFKLTRSLLCFAEFLDLLLVRAYFQVSVQNQLARSKQLTCLVFGDLLAIIKFQNDSNFFEDNILLLHCCCFFFSCFETFFCQDSKICQKENTWTLNHLILTKIWVNEECKIWDIRHRRERRTFSSYVNFLRVGGILHPI